MLHPASFLDDPTRLWRLARYEVRLGADWDPVTWHLAHLAIAGGALETVSTQRLASELRLAVREPDPIGALAAAERLGLPPHLDLDALRLHQAQELAGPDLDDADLVLAALASDDPALPTYLERGEERALIDAALGLRRADGLGRRPGPLDSAAPGSRIAARFDGLPAAAVAAAPDAEAARRWLHDLRHRRLAITASACSSPACRRVLPSAAGWPLRAPRCSTGASPPTTPPPSSRSRSTPPARTVTC